MGLREVLDLLSFFQRKRIQNLGVPDRAWNRPEKTGQHPESRNRCTQQVHSYDWFFDQWFIQFHQIQPQELSFSALNTNTRRTRRDLGLEMFYNSTMRQVQGRCLQTGQELPWKIRVEDGLSGWALRETHLQSLRMSYWHQWKYAKPGRNKGGQNLRPLRERRGWKPTLRQRSWQVELQEDNCRDFLGDLLEFEFSGDEQKAIHTGTRGSNCRGQ